MRNMIRLLAASREVRYHGNRLVAVHDHAVVMFKQRLGRQKFTIPLKAFDIADKVIGHGPMNVSLTKHGPKITVFLTNSLDIETKIQAIIEELKAPSYYNLVRRVKKGNMRVLYQSLGTFELTLKDCLQKELFRQLRAYTRWKDKAVYVYYAEKLNLNYLEHASFEALIWRTK